MNLTPRWIQCLSKSGHECEHWSEVGLVNASDREICKYARAQSCAVLTNDLDFPAILAHTQEAAPSVILLRGEPLTPEIRGEALLKALVDCEAELAAGATLTIDWVEPSQSTLASFAKDSALVICFSLI